LGTINPPVVDEASAGDGDVSDDDIEKLSPAKLAGSGITIQHEHAPVLGWGGHLDSSKRRSISRFFLVLLIFLFRQGISLRKKGRDKDKDKE
jgi:hypothetical protein